MVRQSQEEKAPVYLMLLAVILTSGCLWVVIGKFVSNFISPH
jgi:hypothetical protein